MPWRCNSFTRVLNSSACRCRTSRGVGCFGRRTQRAITPVLDQPLALAWLTRSTSVSSKSKIGNNSVFHPEFVGIFPAT